MLSPAETEALHSLTVDDLVRWSKGCSEWRQFLSSSTDASILIARHRPSGEKITIRKARYYRDFSEHLRRAIFPIARLQGWSTFEFIAVLSNGKMPLSKDLCVQDGSLHMFKGV